jgi:flagellar biosynthesis protein
VGLNAASLPGWLLPRRRLGRQVAVALGYEPGEKRAPEVLAKGFGAAAEHILELAKEHGIPVRQDVDLAEILSKLDVGSQIPDELYDAVAQVLAFIYRMNSSLGGKRQHV